MCAECASGVAAIGAVYHGGGISKEVFCLVTPTGAKAIGVSYFPALRLRCERTSYEIEAR